MHSSVATPTMGMDLDGARQLPSPSGSGGRMNGGGQAAELVNGQAGMAETTHVNEREEILAPRMRVECSRDSGE